MECSRCLELSQKSNVDIVSERMRILSLFNDLVGASFCFFSEPHCCYKIPVWGVKYMGWENVVNIAFYLGNGTK